VDEKYSDIKVCEREINIVASKNAKWTKMTKIDEEMSNG
jgi:hypothetical protein